MSKVFTVLAVFLSALFSQAGSGVNARSCSYDCTSTHPSIFGITNFDSGEPKLINAQTKAFFPLAYTTVCKSKETQLTLFLQPQHVFVNPFDNFDFVVICPHSSDRTINVFSPNFSATDSQTGLTLVRSVVISSSHQVVGFLVKAGYIFVTTTNSLILYNVETLDLLWEYEISPSIGTVSGLPVIGFNHAYVFAGTAIIKLPYGESVIPDVETVTVIDTPNFNILGYGLLDAGSNIYYCSNNGIVKLSPNTPNTDGETYSSYELNLSLSNQQCTSIILSKTGKLMYAAKGVNEEGQFSYSVLVEVSTKFAQVGLSTAVTIATYTNDVINSISRTGWNSGMDPVSVVVLSLDSGVSVIYDTGKNVFVPDDTEAKELARGTLLFHASAKTPIKVKATTSFLGEPVVVSDGEVLGMSDGQLLTFYSPERVYPSVERSSGLGLERKLKYTTAPILIASRGAAVISESGVLHLYGTCNRWVFGGSKPEKNPCPVGDLPTPDALPVALLIAAGASSAFCLPMGLYLCRKAKWNTSQKH